MEDCDCGSLVAMAVAESLAAMLADGDIAGVALTHTDDARETVARPVPTSVAAIDADCNVLGDKTALEDGKDSALLPADDVVTALGDSDRPMLALSPGDGPALSEA